MNLLTTNRAYPARLQAFLREYPDARRLFAGDGSTMEAARLSGESFVVAHRSLPNSSWWPIEARGQEEAVLAALYHFPHLAGQEVELRLVLPQSEIGCMHLGPAESYWAPMPRLVTAG